MGDSSGVIIEESLEKKGVLRKVKIIRTDIEQVTERRNTPWVKQWTLHKVEIYEGRAGEISKGISESLGRKHEHAWYADFKNSSFHYAIFRNKVFKINRSRPEQYEVATKYGVSIGIPAHQVDFSPHI